MLLSTLIIALVSPVWALPTPTFDFDPEAALVRSASQGGEARSSRIARLARTVHDAQCTDQLGNAVSFGRSGEEDVTWQILHQPESDTYTLAFASPPPEDLLELLASVPPQTDGSHLTPLPSAFIGKYHIIDRPLIYAPYAPYLNTVMEATDALSALIKPRSTVSFWLSSAISIFGLPTRSASATPEVEVTGQGLGSVLALLSAIRLSAQHPTVPIEGTLFSLPKVGDRAFATLVDEMIISGRLRLERITSGNDPIPSLPPPHYGLQHPMSISEQHLEFDHASSLGRGPIEDAYGPYEGIMIGLDC